MKSENFHLSTLCFILFFPFFVIFRFFLSVMVEIRVLGYCVVFLSCGELVRADIMGFDVEVSLNMNLHLIPASILCIIFPSDS